jgi:MYXO-CTERM domain-containing protein
MKRLLLLLLLLPLVTGFSTGGNFDADPVKQDGSDKIAFTGSPRFTYHTCEVCHTNAPHQVGLQVQADDNSLFSDGWMPNKQYHMRVVLLNEHAAAQYQSLGDNCGFAVDPYKPCDENGFSLEVDDSGGGPQGGYVPVVNNACANSGTIPLDVDSVVISDGTAVAHNGAHHAQLGWDFCWTAPPAGAGTLVAYVAVIDGNGGDGTMNFPVDTTGDDFAAGQLLLPENGGGGQQVQSGGCAAGGEADLGAALALVGVAALLRGRKRLCALLACAALGGCVHVRPRERETLAKRNMKFGPDPLEDELDLHMQESREGAAGGYGSSGGGCGCN